MQTQDMQAEQGTQRPDAAQLATEAVERYNRDRQDGRVSRELVRERYEVALLAVQYAQLAEARRLTNYLSSIESWLISIDATLAQENEP